MKLNVAVQMDPIARINIRGDSTFALLLEAEKARPRVILLHAGQTFAEGRGAGGAGADPHCARRAGVTILPLASRAARTSALSTSSCCGRTRRLILPTSLRRICSSGCIRRRWWVNDPASVRNAPEKLFVMDFPHLMPPTLISRDLDEINAFRDEHGAVGDEAAARPWRRGGCFGSCRRT